MTLFLSAVLSGLSIGLIYGLLGFSIVVLYRATGVVSFAQSSIAMFTTFVVYIAYQHWHVPLPGALAVAHRDHEFVADEQVDLAGLDGVVLVDVPERLEDQEQRVVVLLQLGTLVGAQRVLDGQLVQAVDLGDPVQLVLGRLEEAHPAEVVLARRLVAELREVVVPGVDGDPVPVAVQRVVDDHAVRLTPTGRRLG